MTQNHLQLNWKRRSNGEEPSSWGFGFSLLDFEKVIAQKNHWGEDSRCK